RGGGPGQSVGCKHLLTPLRLVALALFHTASRNARDLVGTASKTQGGKMVPAIRRLPERSMHFLCHQFWQLLPTRSHKYAQFSGSGSRGAAVLVEISKFLG